MQKARWSTAVAAAALLALPVAASAQSTQGAPQQNPPAQQSQPPASTSTQQQPPATPPQQQPPATATAAAPSAQADASAAKTHLSQARDTLSQLTSLPEAAKLQGTARTQVSQLIADFNALITTQSEWHSAYAKVDADMSALLGPDSSNQTAGTSGSAAAGSGAVGTTGSSAANAPAGGSAQLDPAIRAKLVEFRTHLNEFEKAAGGSSAPGGSASMSAASSGDTAAAAGATPPSVATSSTSNPASPANPAASNPGNPNQSSAASPAPTGTSGVSSSSPTANMDPADRARAEHAVNASGNADAQKELDAISAILSRSKTGALTKAQSAQIKKHVENLRVLLAKQ